MIPYLLSKIDAIMRVARGTYGVDPVIFLVIYLVCAPLWYFSLFRSMRAVSLKRGADVVLWSTVFLATTVAPFIYVMFFGHNLPWWVYVLIAVLVLQAGSTVIRRLRRGPAN